MAETSQSVLRRVYTQRTRKRSLRKVLSFGLLCSLVRVMVLSLRLQACRWSRVTRPSNHPLSSGSHRSSTRTSPRRRARSTSSAWWPCCRTFSIPVRGAGAPPALSRAARSGALSKSALRIPRSLTFDHFCFQIRSFRQKFLFGCSSEIGRQVQKENVGVRSELAPSAPFA